MTTGFRGPAGFRERRTGVGRDKLDDPVITAADGQVVWDCTKYRLHHRGRPGHGESQPVAAGQVVRQAGAFRGDRRASTRSAASTCRTCRSIESDSGVIIIDTADRGNETPPPRLALYRKTPRRPAGQGRDLSRTRTPTTSAATAGVADARHPDLRAGRVPRARGVGERLRRRGDDPARDLHLRGGPAAPDRRGRSAPGSARRRRTAPCR